MWVMVKPPCVGSGGTSLCDDETLVIKILLSLVPRPSLPKKGLGTRLRYFRVGSVGPQSSFTSSGTYTLSDSAHVQPTTVVRHSFGNLLVWVMVGHPCVVVKPQ